MTYAEAMRAVADGKTVRRREWRHGSVTAREGVRRLEYTGIKGPASFEYRGTHQGDTRATDWEVCP